MLYDDASLACMYLRNHMFGYTVCKVDIRASTARRRVSFRTLHKQNEW